MHRYLIPKSALAIGNRQARCWTSLGAIVLLGSTVLWCAGCSPDKKGADDNQPETSSADAERAQRLAEAELDQERQEEIWRAERITFQLERRVGFGLLEAFKAGEPQAFIDLLMEDAQVSMTENTPVVTQQASVSVSKSVAGKDEKLTTVTASDAAAMICDWFNEFSEIQSTAFRVLHIIEQPDTPDRWDAEVLMSVKGIDSDGNPRLRKWTQQVVVDFNDDGSLDQAVRARSWAIVKSQVSTSTQNLFTEITRDVDLHDLGLPDNWDLPPEQSDQYRFQYAVEDFDRDGRLDIAVAPLAGPPMLLRQYPNGKFKQVALERGIVVTVPLENFCCCWIDINRDDFPDLVMGDRLYVNKNGSFEDVTPQSKLVIDPFCMGAIVADYDLDGDQDLYVIYQVDLDNVDAEQSQWVDERMTGKANRLWQNDGNGVFTDVTAQSGAGAGGRHSHAAAWFHMDDDLYPDLYVANDFGVNVVLKNQGDGTFKNVTDSTQAGGYSTSMGVATGDLNNDGQNEIYVANMFSKMGRRIIAYVNEDDYPDGIYDQIVGSCAGNQLFRGLNDGTYSEISEDCGVNGVGWAFAPALADFDNDGLLDIYATTGFMSFDRTKPDG